MTRRPRRRAALLLFAFPLVVAWVMAAVIQSCEHDVTRYRYPDPLAGLGWLTVPVGPGPATPAQAWFRLPFDLTSADQTATLLVQGDSWLTVWSNGSVVGTDEPHLEQGSDTALTVTRQVMTIPLDNVTPGANAIGVDVVDGDSRTPALRAELLISNPGQAPFVAPAAWQASADAGQLGPTGITCLLLKGAGCGFATPGFDAASWSPAVASAPRPGGQASVPAVVAAQAPAGPVMAATDTGQLVLTSRLNLRPGSDVWVRAAADEPLTVAVDGRPVYTDSQPTATERYQSDGATKSKKITSEELMAMRLTPFLAPGANTVSLYVHPAFSTVGEAAQGYLDGFVILDGRTTEFTAGAAAAVTRLGPPAGAWRGVGVQLVDPTTFAKPPAMKLPGHLDLAGEVLGVMSLGFVAAWLVGRRRRLGLRPGLTSAGVVAAMGSLPAVLTALVVGQLAHLKDLTGPFPYTPGVAHFLWVALVAGEGVAAACWAWVRPDRKAGGGWIAAPAGGAYPSHRFTPLAPLAALLRGGAPVLGAPGIGGVQLGAALPRIAARGRTTARIPATWSAVPRWLARRWSSVAVVAIALTMGGVAGYDLGYEPFWQDELASLTAAQGMRQHIIPMWPSGFEYWKGELYSGLIALWGGIFGDSPGVLRVPTVLWFVATVVVFGLGLAKLAFPDRPVVRVLVTALFAFGPPELAHVRDVRMYQMAQCLAIVDMTLLWQAVRTARTRYIAGTAVCTVLMYLSHEETFILLPAIAAVTLVWRRSEVWRDRRWLAWGLGAAAVIGVQLLLVQVTHPPIFGVDRSNGPLVRWDPQGWYYADSFFFPGTTGGLDTVSILAVVGSLVGLKQGRVFRNYLSLLMVVAVVVVSTVLPLREPRYCFVLLPPLYLLATYGLVDIWDMLATGWARMLAPGVAAGRLLGWARLAAAPVFLVVLLTTIGGLGDLGLLPARLGGDEVVRQHIDMGPAGAYVNAHEGPGDAVIACSPANMVGQALGRAPDYWLPYGTSGLLLYVFYKDGRPVDTQYGHPVLVGLPSLEQVAASHPRVWIVTSYVYLKGIDTNERAWVQANFRVVFAGEQSEVLVNAA